MGAIVLDATEIPPDLLEFFEPVQEGTATDTWTVGPQPLGDDHYAAFPEKLVEPCILAGTSEAGCCAQCGAPYRRVVERSPMVIRRSTRREHMGEYGRTQASGTMVQPAGAVTTGWQPGCTCGDAATVPCTVLDPFCGSGTTLLVAKRLGRSAIGIELNASYCSMAQRRVSSVAESLFTPTSVVGGAEPELQQPLDV